MSGTEPYGTEPHGAGPHPGTNGESGAAPQPGQYPPAGSGQYPPPTGQSGQYPPAGGAQFPPPAGQQGQTGTPYAPTPPNGPQGPGPYAYGQPPAGPPSGGSGNNKKALWIILAAVAAFVVLALIAVVVLVVAGGDDDEDGGSGASAGTQPQVVKSYLDAVAEGDAKKALSLAAVEPLSKEFLTDDMLAESAKIAKITDIRVGEVANEYTSQVPATFKIGDRTITQNFSVTKSGDEWRISKAGSELDFTSMRKNTLPLLINGKSLEVDKVTMFPGTYTLSTGTELITYGETGQFTVQGNMDYLRSSELIPVLSEAGSKAYLDAVKASTRACLAKKELSPANCPNQAGTSQTYKIEKNTIKWGQRGGTDPFANLKPRLDYQNPNIATSRPNLQLEIKADCNSSSGKCTLNTYNSFEATIDMTKQPLAVTWVD